MSGFAGKRHRSTRQRQLLALVVAAATPVLLANSMQVAQAAYGEAEHRREPASSDELGRLESALRVPTNRAEVRRLGASRRPAAARLLIQAAHSTLSESPLLCLELVAALDRHLDGKERRQVLLTLLKLLRAETPRRNNAVRNADPAAQRARAAAALSLAASGDLRSLRILLQLAGNDQPLDTTLRDLARLAVRGHPPTSQQLAGLLPPLPTELVQRALHAPLPKRLPLTPDALAELGPTEFARELARLLASPPEIRTTLWQSVDAWTQLLEANPAGGLRALALLHANNEALERLLAGQAQDKLHDPNDVIRSAAAWAWASVEPDQAARLLDEQDPVVQRAVLRQAHHPALAPAALALAERLERRRGQLPPDTALTPKAGRAPNEDQLAQEKLLALVARGTALRHASTWTQLSTRTLRTWTHQTQNLPAWAPLAARASDAPESSSTPTLFEIAERLRADDPMSRTAAAWGLGYTEEPPALALLLSAHTNETDPWVRRTLCRSLARHARELPAPARTSIQRLDPDSDCRLLFDGGRLPLGGVVMSHPTDTHVIWVVPHLGPALPALPAPDGFLAIVGPGF